MGGREEGLKKGGGLGFVSHSERGSKGIFDSANGAITGQRGALGGSERAQARLHGSGNEKRGPFVFADWDYLCSLIGSLPSYFFSRNIEFLSS